MGSSPQGRNGEAGSSAADEPGPQGDAQSLASTDLFHMQTARRKGLKQLGFRSRQVEPCAPVRSFEYNHLAIIDRCHIRSRLGGQERECLRHIAESRPPQPGKAEPVFTGPGETPLCFRGFAPAEFEEMGCGHKATTSRKPTSLRPEVDDRGCLGTGWRKTPPQLCELYARAMTPNDGCDIRWPDVVARFEVQRCLR